MKNHWSVKFAYFVGLLVMVFSAFSTFFGNWLGELYGLEVAIKAGKDLLLFFAAGLLFCVVYFRDRVRLAQLIKKPYNLLVIAYMAWSFGYVLVFDNSIAAEAAGLLFNTRFLILFLLVQLLGMYRPQTIHVLTKTIIGLGIILALLALVQVFVLPKDTLDGFGYQHETGLSYHTIDNDPATIRADATTRGPNELGAFLVIPIIFLVMELLRAKDDKKARQKIWGLLGLLVVALWLTFSRSAGLGLVVAFGSFGALRLWQKKAAYKQLALKVLGGCLLILGAGALLVFNSPTAQQIVLHSELNELNSASSDLSRLSHQRQAIVEIIDRPFGYGLGVAGPASYYNDQPQITENYYLQILLESGVIGATLVFGSWFLVIKRLFVEREGVVPQALLASFAGLALISLLLHGWADDLTSYGWWGLAGAYLGLKPENTNLKPEIASTA